MKFAEAQRKLLILVGVALAFGIPVAIKVLGLSVPVEYLFAVIMMYMAYIIGSLIHAEEEFEGGVGKIAKVEEEIEVDIGKLCKQMDGTGLDLIDPNTLGFIKERVEENKGDVWFFNIPLGRIRTPDGFELFVAAASRNPYTKNISFLLDKSVQELWIDHVASKIAALKTNTNISVKWMKTDKHLAFMLLKGSEETFLFLLEEPFIIQTPKGAQTMALIHISRRPDFIAKLEEIYEKNVLNAET